MTEEENPKKRKQFGLIMVLIGVACIVGLGLGLGFGAIPPDAAGQALVYLLVIGGGTLILYGGVLLISGLRQKQFETIFEEVVPDKKLAITEKIEVIAEEKEAIPEEMPIYVEKIQNYIEKKQSLKKFNKSLKTLEGNIINLRNIELSPTVIHALESERDEVIQQIRETNQEVKEDLFSVSKMINNFVKRDPRFGDKLKEFFGEDWVKIEEIWVDYNAELLSTEDFIEKCYEKLGAFFLHYFLN